MRKAIIHIGAHKTGTTSIQQALWDGVPQLSRLGISYPIPLTNQDVQHYGQHVLAWELQSEGQIVGLAQYPTENAYEKFCNIVKDTEHDLILSSEEFIWFDKDAVTRLISALPDFEIYIVLYVRRQDEAAPALYQTDVIYFKQSQGFDDWLRPRRSGFDYFAIAETWSAIPNSKVIVKEYSRKNLKNGDSITDFESIIKEVFDKEIILPKPPARLNQTVSSSITSMARYYNTQPIGKTLVPALYGFGLLLKAANQREKFQLLAPSTRRSLLNPLHNSNLALSKKYLGLEDIWFDDIVTDDEMEWREKYLQGGSDVMALVSEAQEALFTALKK